MTDPTHPLAGAVKPGTDDSRRCRWPECDCYSVQGPQSCRKAPTPPASSVFGSPGKPIADSQSYRASPTPPADVAGLVEREEFRNTPAEPERGGDETPYDRGYVWGYRHGLRDADATLSARVAELDTENKRLSDRLQHSIDAHNAKAWKAAARAEAAEAALADAHPKVQALMKALKGLIKMVDDDRVPLSAEGFDEALAPYRAAVDAFERGE